MMTKEKLDTIGKFVMKVAPEEDFLVLLVPREGAQRITVVSSIPRKDQPLLAMAFAQGALGIATGDFAAVDPSKFN